ncbi:hypothetical protein NEMBOFW57_000288 [Staphylotrichum longicolle]|uniref:Uncharacterized protein n=1 Tax=Staphylotrichum longicolle TaxID=669026 RepID=A0AAD4EZT9_9PEZI|nr:hypothetical protein NEMBOFW57_000288 [Staphylotrichum longicolle]
MADPVLPAIGVGIGGANLLSNSFATVAKLNSVRHSTLDFKRRVAALRRRIETCEARHLDWTKKWRYDDDGRYPEAIYRELWGSEYGTIHRTWMAAQADLRHLNRHIQSVLDEKRENPAWREHLAVHRVRLLRNIAFALASEASLEDEICRLEATLKSLDEASERQLRIVASSVSDLAVAPEVMMRLGNLRLFGEQLGPRLSELPSTSAWSLELCHPDIGGNAEGWNTLSSLQVWLSYVFDDGPRRRIKLRYSLVDGPSPNAWAIHVTDNIDDTSQATVTYNPAVSQNYPIARQTEAFSSLFMRRAFESRIAAAAWEADKAYLVLSLVNWSLLLWTSDWTAAWCCSGLRFVRAEASPEVVGKKELFLPSFSRCVRQHQRQHQHHGHAHDEGASGMHDCHANQRLAGLGLVLAETICATPFQKARSGYRRWNFAEWRWDDITETKLLDEVEEKAQCRRVRQAVQHCLAVDQGSSSVAAMYKGYVENVFGP